MRIELLLEDECAQGGEGEDPHQLVRSADHREGRAAALPDQAQDLGQRLVLPDRVELAPVDRRDGDALQHDPVRRGVQALSLGGEAERVDRFRLEPRGDHEAQDGGDQRRDGDGVALGHLEEEEDRGERRVRGRGEEGAEADQRVGAARPRQPGQEHRRERPEASARHGPDEEDGPEDAARRAAAERERAAGDLREREHGHARRGEPAGQRVVHDVVAVRDVPRHGDVQHADQREPGEQDGRPRPGEAAQVPGDGMEETRVRRRQQAEDDAERGVREALPVALEAEGGHHEDRGALEEAARDDDRRRGGDQDQREVDEAHLAEEHDLVREHERPERRVEGRRDAGGGTAGDQYLALLAGEAGELCDGAADRTADLRDRPLAADGRARAQRHRRPERLHHHPAPLHARALEVQHLEKAREAVAEHLAGEEPVEDQQDETTGDEGQGDATSQPGGLILEKPLAAADGFAKDDVAHGPEDAGHHRQRDRPGTLGLAPQDLAQSQRLRHSKHL